jgi:ribose 5-phosphate isomerase B
MEPLPEKQICRVYIGSDHAGYEQKENIKDLFATKYKHIEIVDTGCYDSKSCHYTDIAHKVSQQVIQNSSKYRGILLCTTGTGMSIVANRYPTLRCVYGHNVYQVNLARLHNNVNVLALGVQVLELSDMRAMVMAFMETTFDKVDQVGNNSRHHVRVNKIDGDFNIKKLKKISKSNINYNQYKSLNTSMSMNSLNDHDNNKIEKSSNSQNKSKLTKSNKSISSSKQNVNPVNVKLTTTPFKIKEAFVQNANDTNSNVIENEEESTMSTKQIKSIDTESIDDMDLEINRLKPVVPKRNVQVNNNQIDNDSYTMTMGQPLRNKSNISNINDINNFEEDDDIDDDIDDGNYYEWTDDNNDNNEINNDPKTFEMKTNNDTENKKIEPGEGDIILTEFKAQMVQPLDYPETIDDTKTVLAVMNKYQQNCDEVRQIQSDLMKNIVEMRERVRLINRDLNAEMSTLFNVSDNQTNNNN